jgi:hypothetical protein
MYGISIRAVILASLAVFGVDIVSGALLIGAFGGPALDSGMSEEQMRQAFLVLFQDARYLTFALLAGTASTVLGGYLAARLARTLPYFNALAFGVLSLVVSMVTSGDLPTWFKVFGIGITLPAALLGGHLAKLRMSKPES